MTRWLETDTFTDKDISAPVVIGSYASDGDRLVKPQLLLSQVAGNGDYVYYVTLQVGGSGAEYVMGPKTTHAVASGETAIGAQGDFVFVRSGDVLKVYVDGLAGDNANPDTIVRWCELAALRPATADRTLNVSSGGVADADMTAISADSTAADNLETMLDGTGGQTLTLKKLTINNTDPTGIGLQVSGYTGAHITGTNRGMTLQGGANQALYLLADSAAATIYIEGPSVGGGSALAISSPGSLPVGAPEDGQAIKIELYDGHPAVRAVFVDIPGDVLDVVDSDNGDWVWDDKLFAAATDAADAVRTELATELAHLDADVSDATSLTAQQTRDAMKLAPTAGTPAAGSVDAHLDSLLTTGSGSGTGTYSDTVTDGADPLDNVLVQLSTDAAGTNMAYRTYSAADGSFTMRPDPGTYYVWFELAGYSFTQGAQVVVT